MIHVASDERGPVWAEPRWWSASYAIRLAIALIIAAALVGSVVGPLSLVVAQFQASLTGGALTFPAWMYWQAAGIHVAIGLILASGTSLFAVLLGSYAEQHVIVARILSGPLMTGGLYMLLLLALAGAPTLLQTLPEAALACAVFFGSALLFGVTRPERLRRSLIGEA